MKYENKLVHGQQGMFAAKNIDQGEIIFALEGEIINQPNRLSIQIDKELHIQPKGDTSRYLMNHHCDGNSYIDTIERSFKANRSIKKGEEITFNYNSTEWKMSDPFECWCCNKAIKGFAFLSDEDIKKMEQSTIAPFLYDLKKRLTLQA